VIARVWAAQTTSGQLPAYLEHLRSSVLPGLQGLDGYSGVTVLDRPLSEGIEVIVITYWRSIDVIRGFAGADVEKAVVAKEAAVLLSRFDDRVRHYVVAYTDSSAEPSRPKP
jgi:heme-degrading monooxygenase HmoA